MSDFKELVEKIKDVEFKIDELEDRLFKCKIDKVLLYNQLMQTEEVKQKYSEYMRKAWSEVESMIKEIIG